MWIGVLLSLFLSANAELTTVQQAREAFLNDGRKKALNILMKEIKATGQDDSALELKEGEKLATRFKTDEAQREFELGESLYFSEEQGALDKYKVALQVEPDNIAIMYAMVRHFLRVGSCSAANMQLKKARRVWRYTRLQNYYNLKLNECEGKSLNYNKVKALETKNPELQPYLTAMEMRALVEKGKGKQALALEKEFGPKQKTFSELFYWLFKAGELEDGGDIEYLRKYIKICQSYGAAERRSFHLEPLLCGRIKEVRAMVRRLESGGV